VTNDEAFIGKYTYSSYWFGRYLAQEIRYPSRLHPHVQSSHT